MFWTGRLDSGMVSRVARGSYVLFLDESGDEGFQFDRGSSAWFAVGGILVRRDDERRVIEIVDRVRSKLNEVRQSQFMPPKKPLHFRNMRHPARKFYATQIGTSGLEALCHIAYKPSERVKSPYFVAATRVTAWALELISPGSQIELVVAARSGISHASFVEKFWESSEELPVGITADRVSAIRLFSPGQRAGLQCADAVASSVFMAWERNHFGQTELSYVRAMQSCLGLNLSQILSSKADQAEKMRVIEQICQSPY